MPLEAGTSPETITSNIKETLESGTFARGKPKKKRHQMAVAAAMRKKTEGETLSQAAFRKKRGK